MREREPLASLALYSFSKWWLINPILYTYFRLRVYGLEKVPMKGPLVLVSNHASYLDPPIVSTCISRPVAFMAKEELFQVPVLKQIIRMYGAYPVKRSAVDRQALKAAVQSIQEGWTAGVFLSGTRTVDGRITEPKTGALLIAAQTQAPLLPVCIWGTHKILTEGGRFPASVPLTVRIGAPLPPPTSTKKQDLQASAEHCALIINQMHDLGR